jgi:hypothetical protein
MKIPTVAGVGERHDLVVVALDDERRYVDFFRSSV